MRLWKQKTKSSKKFWINI